MTDFQYYLDLLDERFTVLVIGKENSSFLLKDRLNATRKILQDMREEVRKKPFKNISEEIRFFRHIKPQVAGRLIFYAQLLVILTQLPIENKKAIKRYLLVQIKSYQDYLTQQADFLAYYKSNDQYLDHIYFVHYQNYSLSQYRIIGVLADEHFTTRYDMVAAQLIGYEFLVHHLHREIEALKEEDHKQLLPLSALTWTATKVDLVELIYALHTAGVFNRGAADLKQIVAVFEQSFQIKLGDVYRSFLEIRSRKMDATKFLSLLKHLLQQRMYEADE